jgi:hypothetical protein
MHGIIEAKMSTMNPSTLTNDHDNSVRSTLAGAVSTLGAPVRALSFWSAILLPFTYLPLLAGGLTGGELSLIAVLLAANATALLLGHNHGR